MKLKNLADAAVAAVDKKLQRFDPKWQARNGAGGLRSRYQDKTGIARYREWRGVKDTFADYGAWLNNLMSMAAMVAKAPVPALAGMGFTSLNKALIRGSRSHCIFAAAA